MTHYESPPRRKLRQEEDDNLAEIEGKQDHKFLALHREAPEPKVDTQNTVNRLLMARQEKEDRLSYLRQRVGLN